ncbi:MAG: cysteine--tRNA ligase [Pseudomonadota bacterium]
MDLKLHNSLTHQKEPFKSQQPGKVSLYVCGPTVYDRTHIGNARPIVVFDALYRILRHTYAEVAYVRNITDVDDKINNRAAEKGIPIQALTQQTIAYFHQDIAALNALPPSREPRATDHIPEMIAMINDLLDKGHAYVAEGHVLFSVASLSSYGALSKRSLDDMLAGARVEIAPYKRAPADFVLWKPSASHLPGWKSPWGRGRPGWHIECSAMSCKYLGASFDIHGGGQDLIFPHHENELAQSVATNGPETFARYWMHNGMLTVNGEKMSKSLGNFVTLHDALQQHHGETVRFLLLSTHYRQSLNWSDRSLEQAKNSLDRLYNSLRGAADVTPGEIAPKMLAALADDLNTPLALACLFELAQAIHTAQSPEDKHLLQETLLGSAQFLGFLEQSVEDWMTWTRPAAHGQLTEERITRWIEARNQARKQKDFSEADRIRDLLHEHNIELEDTPQGTLWRRK